MPLPSARAALPPPCMDGMLRPYAVDPPREPSPYATGDRVCRAGAERSCGAAPYPPAWRDHDADGVVRLKPDPGAERVAVRGSAYPPAGALVTLRGVEK